MPYKRKDSEVWWINIATPDGKRIRRSTKTTDRKEAVALEAKWRFEFYRQDQWDEQPPWTFDDLMLRYLKATMAEKRRPERDRVSARNLYVQFSEKELAKLNARDIRTYIDARRQQGIKPGTINKELGLLSAAINYARREWDWDIPNPVLGRKPREPEGRLRWLTRIKAETLIRCAEEEPRAPHLADFIRLALNTGCRCGELLGLEWQRVDFSNRLIYLEAIHTKSNRRRYVPINENARNALVNRMRFRSKHCPSSPWVFCHKNGNRIQWTRRSFKTALRKAGIEDFRIHDLRHTCAAWLVSAGVPLIEVRDLLGHRSITMTERYAHLAPDNIRTAVATLDGDAKSRFGHVLKNQEMCNTVK